MPMFLIDSTGKHLPINKLSKKVVNMEKQEIQALIDSLGIAYKADFVPQSQSRNKNEKPCLNWKITLSKGNQSITTDYTQGIGHLPKYDYSHSNKIAHEAPLKQACETGKWEVAPDGWPISFPTKKISAPEFIDVLYSLIMDCDVIDYPNFEDWAQCFGYDPDSRNAEKIYNECMKQYLQLRALIGYVAIEKLREAYQGY